MNEDLLRAYYMLGNLFTDMPPAVFVVASLTLLAVALWQSHHALHSYRIVSALVNAPLADLRSNAAGLVKLRGTAQAPPAQPGKSASAIVWYSRSSRSGSNSSTLETTDNFLIRDGYSVCAVETEKADMVPTAQESSHAFLDKSRSTVEKVIHSGDPVFAIGELRRGLPPLAGVSEAPCQLSRFGGVLLVSGSPERNVKVLYVLWSLVHSLLGLLCWGALAFGAWTHISSYPPSEGSAVKTFFDSLRTAPLQSQPGVGHPLWDKVEKGQNGSASRSN